MGDDQRDTWLMSTPMIKGELLSLLTKLAPDKRWPKSTQLKDLIAFTLSRFNEDTADSGERRALDLAHVIHNSERR